MACERQLDFTIPIPVQDVFQYVSSQKAIYKMQLAAVDQQNWTIFFKKKAGLMTWGEHIAIRFYDPLDGGCRIIVTSEPAMATTLVDYGANAENCNMVRQFLLSSYGLLPEQTPQR